MSPRQFLLALAFTPGIGGRTIRRIQTRNQLLGRSGEDFLRLAPEVWREEYRLSNRAADNLSRQITNSTATQEMVERIERLGVRVFAATDAAYPARIEDFDPDPPGVLFAYGNHRLLESPTFSVLSSRAATPAQLDDIERLTEAGVLGGEVLVTGHDRPEYQRSAVVPLRWGAPRVLVLDRGLFQVLGPDLRSEAFRAARLWRYEFDPKTDLAMSPFRPDGAYIGVNNQVRDRLVASLSARIDFAHLSPTGGMAKLARMARQAGRPLRIGPHVEPGDPWMALGIPRANI